MATIRQISKHAQVSIATVSRVINNSKWVAEATREKVLDAINELGYRSNKTPGSIDSFRSNIVGLVVSDLSGPFFGDMMHNIEDVLRQEGRQMIVSNGHGDLSQEREAIHFLLKHHCDALILHLDAMSDEEIIGFVQAQKTPVVLINRYIPALAKNCIAMDNEQGGYLAAKSLLDRGHRKLVCLTGPLFKPDARSRFQGFRRAVEEYGLRFSEDRVVEADFNESSGAKAISRILKRNLPFTGVVCGNDLMAIGAIRRLQEYQLKVPDDVSVVGYDDVMLAGYFQPSLATVRVPVNRMAQQAAKLAISLSQHQKCDINRIFKPDLVLRQSVKEQAFEVAEPGRVLLTG
ncbi:LacI family DNA-binding transcriptional regulator [Gynuella sp.]|uniref:LacI family DNA-binding transcriptional regulator n=1 Tax=Gynuella sp. TaxID=2969146 RepID=UPI003D13536D